MDLNEETTHKVSQTMAPHLAAQQHSSIQAKERKIRLARILLFSSAILVLMLVSLLTFSYFAGRPVRAGNFIVLGILLLSLAAQWRAVKLAKASLHAT